MKWNVRRQYLLRILPNGVESKNNMGARSILSSNLACSIPAALIPPMYMEIIRPDIPITEPMKIVNDRFF